MKKQLLTILALCTLTATTMAQVPSYVPTNGLAGWWPFNGDADDESSNTNNGTVTGAMLTTDRFGNANAAYDFDGVDDMIDCGNSSDFDLNNLSISAWYLEYSYSEVNQSHGIVSKATHSSGEIGYRTETSEQDNYIVWSRMGTIEPGTAYAQGSSASPLNQWNHIVVTKNADVLSIYRNGVSIGSATGATASYNNSNPLTFGSIIQSGGGFGSVFLGKLDDIGIWDRALSEEEITILYTSCMDMNAATITPQSSTTFCEGDSVVLLASGGGTYQWNTGAVTTSIVADQDGDYSVIATDDDCSSTSETVTVVVNQLPSVSLAPLASICENANAVVLSGGSPSGGTYTVNGNPSSLLDPATTGSGQQTIGYTYMDQNNCEGTASQTVDVNGVPNTSLSGLNSSYTLADDPSVLVGTPSGGFFNGEGVANGMFDPAVAGLGTHSVSYAVVDGNGCIGVASLCATVDVTVGIGGVNIGSDGGVDVYPNPSTGQYILELQNLEGLVSYIVYDSRGREVSIGSLIASGNRTQHNIDLNTKAKGIYTLQLQTAQGTLTHKLVKN